jgi:hypothetical protein
MSKQEQAARDLEAAAAELTNYIQQCPDEDWHALSATEGWTRAAVAYHCATGNDVALGWICQMLDRRRIHETGETHNAANAADAQRHELATKAEAVETLRRTTLRTSEFLRSLTDEELERSAFHGVANRVMTVSQFIINFSRHMTGHLAGLAEPSARAYVCLARPPIYTGSKRWE